MPRKPAGTTATKASRLKVFQARFGFYDSIVAVPSQPAALRAWGTHQNLFADGQARVVEDPDAVAAALAHPNVPLRRALGSTGAFALEPTSLPVVPDLPKGTAKRAPRKPKAEERPPPRPDRSVLDAAEGAVAALAEERRAEEHALEDRQNALDAERTAARARYRDRHEAVMAAVAIAREAYRKAGGTD